VELYGSILGLALLSGCATLLGVLLAVWLGDDDRAVAVGLGFSAGIMLLIASLELIPAATEMLALWPTLLWTGGGLLFLALANYLIPHTHLVDETEPFQARQFKTAYLVVFGLALHDFPEGFALTNAFLVEPSLGVLVAVGIALHNIPEEFAMAVPALATKSRRLLFGGAVVSALAEPAGAALGLVAVHFRPGLNEAFMAFAAGAMIFVSLHELLPAAHRYGRMALFGVGLAVSALVYAVLAWIIGG
jgi:ZIP family zinc transporter